MLTGIIVTAPILLINLLILSSSTTSVVGQNSCHLRELDLCAASLLVFTQAPNGLASSDSEINKQCSHLKDADNCLKNYTRRCMTPIQRELMTFTVNSTFGMLDEYCTKGSRLRQNYLKHATCLNQIQKKQEHKSCIRDLQASLDLLTANNIPGGGNGNGNGKNRDKIKRDDDSGIADLTGKRLQLACCSYRRFESCLGGQMEKRCGKETIQFVQSIIRRATSRMPETICRQFKPDGQECRAILPKSGSTSKGSKSNSIISRLLSAYSSF